MLSVIQVRQNPRTLQRSLAWAPLAIFQEPDKDDILRASFASYISEDCPIPPVQLRIKHLLTSSQLECRQSKPCSSTLSAPPNKTKE